MVGLITIYALHDEQLVEFKQVKQDESQFWQLDVVKFQYLPSAHLNWHVYV